MEDPVYIRYNSLNISLKPLPHNQQLLFYRFSSYWDEIIITGIVPLAALIFFNTRIYLKVGRGSKNGIINCLRSVKTRVRLRQQYVHIEYKSNYFTLYCLGV